MPKFSTKNKKILFGLLCSLVFVVSFILVNLFSFLILKTESATSFISSPSFEIHFLSLSKSQVKQEALALCVDEQKNNSAGYIWRQDKYYHLISSAYLNKNDAVLVQNTLLDTKSEILTIKFDSISINGNFNNDEGKILTKALSCPIDYYKEIYDISVSVDTSVYNEISARMAVNNAHNNLASIIDNFLLLFKSYENDVLNKFKNILQNIQNISQKLCGGTLLNNTQTYSSLLKYRYTEVLECYYEFVKQ